MTPSARGGRAIAASVRSVAFGRARRHGVVGSLTLAALLALVAGTALVVLDPVPSPAAAASCGPAPQGRVAVVVVVDHGGGSAPSSRCVVVDQGATGLDALRAAGHQVRLDGGFVCAIDARPATGCGNVPGNPYWRYWHAAPGGAWDYSQVGAGGYRLPSRCAVEGWSWSDSTTERTPPRAAAPTPTCEAAPPPTASPGPPATTAPVVAPAQPASPGAPPAAGGVSPGSPATGNGAGSGPADADGTSGAAAGEAADGAGSDAGDGDGSADEAGASVDGGAPADGDAGSSDQESAERTADSGPGDVDGEFAAARGAAGADGGSTPWGVLIAVVLVAVLAGASVMRTRARRHDPATPSG